MGRPHGDIQVAQVTRADPNIAKDPPKSLGPFDAAEDASTTYGRLLFQAAFQAENPDVFGKAIAKSSDTEADKLVDDLADVIARGALIQDVTGRQEMLDSFLPKGKRARVVDFGGLTQTEQDFVTIPFDDAANAIMSKTLLPANTIDEILDAYEQFRFAIQADITREVLDIVKRTTARMVGDGGTPEDFVKFARGLGEGVVSDAYARTFFRTEATNAHAAGRVKQAFSEELDDFVVAFKYVAVGDADTRANHFANDGLFFDKRDDKWAGRIPPNGFNCRCRLLTISKLRAKRMDRWDERAKKFKSDPVPTDGAPDPGFENSPLLRVYG